MPKGGRTAVTATPAAALPPPRSSRWHHPPTKLLTLVAALSILAAQPASAVELRLGGAIALTGRLASDGLSCVQGWTLWAERLNAIGGITLPDGEVATIKLPLDIRDDASSKETSKEVLADMLNTSSPNFANLDFVIGPFSSGITGGNAAVAAEAKRILFSHGASESLYNVGNGYIFSVLTPGRGYMGSGLELLRSRGALSVAFGHEAKVFSKSVCSGANITAHALGMTTKGYFEYEPGTTNFADIVFNIKKQNPDVYVSCGHIDDITYLIGQLNVLNVNPKALLVTHAADMRIVENVGVSHSHGLFSPTQWHKGLLYKDSDGFFGSAHDFNDMFVERWGSEPPYQAAYAAAMGYALQKAIEVAGAVDTESVRVALQNLRVDSFYGTIEFSREGDPSGLVGTMPRRAMVTTQLQEGTAEVVAPPAAANATPVYPLATWAERAKLFYPCPIGSVEDGLDGNGQARCKECPAGRFRDEGLLSCTPCPAGSSAPSPGSSGCSTCPAGTWSGLEASNCTQCPGGTICSEGTSQPRPCPSGHYCEAGAVLPSPCPSGTHRQVQGGDNVTSCHECPPGQHNDGVGKSACDLCPPGWHTTLSGQRDCERCPFDSYQDLPGQANCTRCRDTFHTWLSGAQSESACICNEGSFLDRAAERCIACPEGLVCPGGMGVPFVKQGYYAETQGEVNASLGSPDAFSSLLVWSCPPPSETRCPGSSLPHPMGQGDVIDSVRLPGQCPPHHLGITCSACESGYALENGRCKECNAASPLLVLAALLVIWGCLFALYRFSAQPDHTVSASLLLGGSVGCAVSFVQFLGVLTSFNFELPGSVETLMEALSIFLLDVRLLRAECSFGSTFAAQHLTRLAMPLVVLTIFFGTWGVSQVVHRLSRGRVSALHIDHIIDSCGTAATALYVPICKLSLAFFECRTHSAGPDTLIAYPSVVVDSEEHSALLVVGILSLLIYVVGLFAVLVYASVVAAAKVQTSEHYRRALRFVYCRWKPSQWYWTLIYICRNLLVSLVAVMAPGNATLQCSLLLIFLTVALAGQAYCQPWHDTRNNCVELAMMGCLCCIVALSFKFANLTQDPGLIDKTEEAIGIVMYVIFQTVAAVFVLQLVQALYLKKTRKLQEERHHARLMLVASAYVNLGDKLKDVEVVRLAQAISRHPESDIIVLQRMAMLMCIVYGIQKSSGASSSTGSAGRQSNRRASSSLSSLFVSSTNFGPFFRERRQLQSDTIRDDCDLAVPGKTIHSNTASEEVCGMGDVGSFSVPLASTRTNFGSSTLSCSVMSSSAFASGPIGNGMSEGAIAVEGVIEAATKRYLNRAVQPTGSSEVLTGPAKGGGVAERAHTPAVMAAAASRSRLSVASSPRSVSVSPRSVATTPRSVPVSARSHDGSRGAPIPAEGTIDAASRRYLVRQPIREATEEEEAEATEEEGEEFVPSEVHHRAPRTHGPQSRGCCATMEAKPRAGCSKKVDESLPEKHWMMGGPEELGTLEEPPSFSVLDSSGKPVYV